MTTDPSFEEYLVNKKIDSEAFKNAEPQVWNAWKKEFEQVHPNSFTVQKLNLINPVRRKYMLPATQEMSPIQPPPPVTSATSPAKPGRPVMKPRTKPES